jgi:hypothetical protein
MERFLANLYQTNSTMSTPFVCPLDGCEEPLAGSDTQA